MASSLYFVYFRKADKLEYLDLAIMRVRVEPEKNPRSEQSLVFIFPSSGPWSLPFHASLMQVFSSLIAGPCASSFKTK